MKKILFIAFFAITSMVAQAQFGVKGGLNIANWGGEDADDEGKKSLLGFYGGVFYNIKCGEMFSVQPELVYSGQGVKYEIAGDKVKVPTSYLNITPLVRFNTSSGFFVGIGPQIGFLLSAKLKEDGQPDVDFKDEMKKTDVAAVIAVGYVMDNGFGFYARYNHGLTTISDAADTKVFNRVFQIGVRYEFNLSGGAK